MKGSGDDPRDLERGRELHGRRAWARAHEALARADALAPLCGDDLERLAVAAYFIGRDTDYLQSMERAHHAHLAAGAQAPAARAAVWLGLRLLLRGETAGANGWLARAQRLLQRQGDCVERGYLALLAAEQDVEAGDWEGAQAGAAAAEAAGERFADPDLVAAAVHLRGRVRMQLGQIAEGLSLLDEAMVGVVADELSPLMGGLIYCSAIDACREVYALDRAREWTAALGRWCAEQPEMVAFVGVCQVHRSEILQLDGCWADALAEAQRAGERCLGVNRLAAAAAFYQQGEVHRLRGELVAAEAAYRDASQWGLDPQPGLAQLRLAQGHTAAAAAAIRRALGETTARARRPALLAAQVEVMLATGDTSEARTACRELHEIAESFGSRVLGAVAAQAAGAVALAEGTVPVAAGLLRRAWQVWQELPAPYPAARVRVLLGRCCRALGDLEGAELELRAARTVFEQLGARPDLARLEAAGRTASAARPHGLTQRELEVLRLVATGKSNKDIASSLFLSERTVERHVSNIFRKLDVPSRAAATAHAYQHALV
jgi:DNA-binding CsgD family transcriptional regulator